MSPPETSQSMMRPMHKLTNPSMQIVNESQNTIMTQTPPIPSDPLGKITHKTTALMSSNATFSSNMSKEKKAKYQ